MTTDPGLVPLAVDRDAIRRTLLHGTAALVGWLLLIVALTPVLPMSDTVIAVGSPEKVCAHCPKAAWSPSQPAPSRSRWRSTILPRFEPSTAPAPGWCCRHRAVPASNRHAPAPAR
jgi:hypothetical protein